MCSTVAGSSTFLVAGGKAIFINSSAPPSLCEWACGPERLKECARGLSTSGPSPQLLRSLTAALFENEQVDTIECESAEFPTA
jgi:hypothetical protein